MNEKLGSKCVAISYSVSDFKLVLFIFGERGLVALLCTAHFAPASLLPSHLARKPEECDSEINRLGQAASFWRIVSLKL